MPPASRGHSTASCSCATCGGEGVPAPLTQNEGAPADRRGALARARRSRPRSRRTPTEGAGASTTSPDMKSAGTRDGVPAERRRRGAEASGVAGRHGHDRGRRRLGARRWNDHLTAVGRPRRAGLAAVLHDELAVDVLPRLAGRSEERIGTGETKRLAKARRKPKAVSGRKPVAWAVDGLRLIGTCSQSGSDDRWFPSRQSERTRPVGG